MKFPRIFQAGFMVSHTRTSHSCKDAQFHRKPGVFFLYSHVHFRQNPICCCSTNEIRTCSSHPVSCNHPFPIPNCIIGIASRRTDKKYFFLLALILSHFISAFDGRQTVFFDTFLQHHMDVMGIFSCAPSLFRSILFAPLKHTPALTRW